MADSKEAQFQQDIISAMVAQGWLTGPASGYDRATALYTEDFFGYFKGAWPERWDKFAKSNPNNPEGVLVQKLVRELEQDGTLDVLRRALDRVTRIALISTDPLQEPPAVAAPSSATALRPNCLTGRRDGYRPVGNFASSCREAA